MASTAVDHSTQLFSCRCLNVRLRSAPIESTPPESSNDAVFLKIHVTDDGIQVAHPQLTLRVKSRGEAIPGTAKSSRFATLTCLGCDLPVYRVHQIISSEVEAKDLPLLPSDDWAEQEIMKSPSGWIEVHKDCLTGDAIARLESLSDYSGLFSLVLPPASEVVPASPTTWISPESMTSSTPTPTIPTSYLVNLPPLFPPPPFTPSHPAFLHLASLAQKESQALRESADEELTRIVRAKAAEVQANEAELKAQVERLWLKFRQGLEKIQHDRPQAPSFSGPWSSATRASELRNNGQKAPVAIRDFVPVTVAAPARSTPPPLRVSALSASLANSNLHQAMADKNARHSSASNGSEPASSIHSGSPTLVTTSTNERETTSVLQFRRVVDDTINTAASFRYFMNIEEEMARHRKDQEQEANPDHDETMGIPGPSSRPVNGTDNGPSEAASNGPDAKEESKDKKEPKAKSKHVHFNVQPAVGGTKPSATKRSEKASKPDSGEMVFALDDDAEGGEQPSGLKASLPLLEQPAIPPRARRSKPQPAAGLPASFSALRPASLPAPSEVRPGRSPSNDPYSNNIMLSLPRPSGPVSKATNGENREKEDTTDQETSEDTTDSSPRPTSDSESDSEDHGYEYHSHNRCGIPGSLPINIVSSIRPREVLSLASYQPKSSAAERQQAAATAPTGGVGHPKKMSTSAIRRAAYAARDRTRPLDPGNLDFVAEEDEEEDEERSDRKVVVQSMEAGERARKHALKILQARAELPEEGMWRSLAS